MRRLHRALGVVLVLPLVLWIATGLLFHVKHRYDEAYEALAVPLDRELDWSQAKLAPAHVVEPGLAAPPPALAAHPAGRLAWFGAGDGAPVALDAASGEPIALADDAVASAWIAAAIARSPHAARYGAELERANATERSALTGTRDP